MFSVKLACRKTLTSRLIVVTSSRLLVTADAKQEVTSKESLPFDEIPGPTGKLKTPINFYRESHGFRKHHKLSVKLFDEYGPIFKEMISANNDPVVHVMEPRDFETVYRAEGKYPRRDPVFFLEEYRKRRGRPEGLESL